MSNKVCAVFWS